jgi:hypothetical protein
MFPLIIFTSLALVFLLRLIYVIANPLRRKLILDKYKFNDHAYDVYGKLYSRQFLIIWGIITLWLAFNLLFSWYRSVHGRIPTSVVFVALTISVGVSSFALRRWSTLFKK